MEMKETVPKVKQPADMEKEPNELPSESIVKTAMDESEL